MLHKIKKKMNTFCYTEIGKHLITLVLKKSSLNIKVFLFAWNSFHYNINTLMKSILLFHVYMKNVNVFVDTISLVITG